MQKFIPLLFNRIQHTRTLPCRVAAARTLLVILRFTVKVDDRSHIIFRIQKDLANGKSCHTRMLFLRLCEMAISLFSKQYFKRNFFDTVLLLAKDRVPNIRLKLCGILPRLKSLLSLPSDRGLLQQLEDTIKVFFYLFIWNQGTFQSKYNNLSSWTVLNCVHLLQTDLYTNIIDL